MRTWRLLWSAVLIYFAVWQSSRIAMTAILALMALAHEAITLWAERESREDKAARCQNR